MNTKFISCNRQPGQLVHYEQISDLFSPSPEHCCATNSLLMAPYSIDVIFYNKFLSILSIFITFT
ncbi:MAG: hypothetical protein H6Q13_1050 [Bacteroidetes bacterium]|nr:hypothetical protein [Bacteroidota bacterium]